MPKLKETLSSIFTPNNSTKKNAGRLESDALPVRDAENENNVANNNIVSPLLSPTASTDLTNSVVRELSNPNYNSASGEVIERNENGVMGATGITTNVQNNQQQNIVMQFSNSNNVHLGSVYNFDYKINTNSTKETKPQKARKTTSIVAMMQSQEEPNHRMLDTIATHLGEGWKQVMRDLGNSDGQIEQAIIDHQMHGGIKEVIYQLLLQWLRGADDNVATLGHITTLLWESNLRDCVQRMKLVWKSEANRKT